MINVPHLTPKQIDREVNQLLDGYRTWLRGPVNTLVDVENIAEGFMGMALEVDDLKSRLGMNDVLGATWFEERRVCIDQSLEDNEDCFCFTVAHELGHWQLHQPLFAKEKVSLPLFPMSEVDRPSPAVVCRSSEIEAPAEWQADQFAARLLMPARLVLKAIWDLHDQDIPVIETHSQSGLHHPDLRFLADEVRNEGQFLNVSNENMCERLIELDLVHDPALAQRRLL